MKNLVIVELYKMSSFEGLKKFNKRNFILSILLLVVTVSGYSQSNRVMHVNDFLTNQLATSNRSTTNETISKFKSYLKDLNPSVYVNNNVVNQKSDAPVCLYTDVKSIRSLNALIKNGLNIEYALIKIKSKNDIVSPIDLSVFKEFPNLKYILLEFEFEVSRSAAETSATNANEDQYVLYKVEIQS
jgi:hypothetical protein